LEERLLFLMEKLEAMTPEGEGETSDSTGEDSEIEMD
jgi:hypothetical protein